MNRPPPQWNKDAAALLRQFLESGVGAVFLAHISFDRPALLTGDHSAETVALRAAQVAGYEQCVRRIFSLAEPPEVDQPSTSENYPPLDDDSKWGNDNQ